MMIKQNNFMTTAQIWFIQDSCLHLIAFDLESKQKEWRHLHNLMSDRIIKC